jgi:superfamily II DNA or RNA helicase
VKGLYDKYDKGLEVVDEERVKTLIDSIEIGKTLKSIGKEPRQYQLDILDAVKRSDHGIIRAATGAGKTLCSTMMVAHFGKYAIIYVIGKDLLHQTHGFFEEVFDQKIGKIGDGICEIEDINIASVWTIGQALGMDKSSIILDSLDGEEMLSHEKYKSILDMMAMAKVHIFDECHLAACDTIQEISRNIKPEYIYGMSASPWRDDNKDLLIEAIFGDKIVDISASYLIRNKYLTKPTIRFIDNPKYGRDAKYPTIYKNYIVKNDIRNANIVKSAVKLVELGYQPLVSYIRIAHGKSLYEQISDRMPCILLSGKDSIKKRNEAKKKLENKEINCILASKIFDMGVDLPSLSGLINAGGGKSSVRALQRVGRVLRTYPGKNRSIVVEFFDRAKFLKKHSRKRRDIYLTEEEFDVICPKR